VALAGLFVLSYSGEKEEGDSSSSSNTSSFDGPWFALSWGDWCCMLAALCWSFYIYRLSALGEYFDETRTQFAKNIVLATLYTMWMLGSLASKNSCGTESRNQSDGGSCFYLWKGWRDDPTAWFILFYSALGPCTIADVCQQKAQACVPAAETNVILSLEPVFTTLLGLLLLGEMPSPTELFGGLLIITASIVASCDPLRPTSASR